MKYISKMMLMAALAVTMGLAAQTAKADTVTFTSTGIFTNDAMPGSGTSSITVGTAPNTTNLTFTDGVNSVSSPPAQNVNFGTITIATLGNGASLNGTTLMLNITQTSPSAGGGTFTGQLTGTISVTPAPGGSNATLTFSQTTFSIGGVVYTIDPFFRLPAPGTGNSVTLQGTVSAPAAVPEPATMLLLGTGLTGLAGYARRRRMK